MSYSLLDIFKTLARDEADRLGLKLSRAKEHLARQAGFADLHELTAVAKKNPEDPRLMKVVFGVAGFSDAIHDEPAYSQFCARVDERLSGKTAETNAYAFMVEGIDVLTADYDEDVGLLTLNLSFSYNGEQDQDQTYVGSSFEVEAHVNLKYRHRQWSLADDPLVILRCDNKIDIDDYTYRYSDIDDAQARAIAAEFNLSIEDAEIVSDSCQIHEMYNSDDMITGFYIDTYDVEMLEEPLRSRMMAKRDGSKPMVELSLNWFDKEEAW